ncbi:MAG: aminodeoxychorismate/anthranilate synthase component II [Bacteroidia bacterium]|nr:aminodeoxychorismate/anthranilate synthase component II [Bacteroidia bacterium]
MKIMVLDNYDSFTFNLVHYLESLIDGQVDVFRNDEIDLEQVNNYDAIVLSPGPGLPNDAGVLVPLIQKYASSKKILGVCLGHQAIAVAFGAKLKQLNEVLHGITHESKILNEQDALFSNVPVLFDSGRYHSWVIDKSSLPNELEIIATDHDDEIMGIKHKQFDIYGVQFHPESVMTEHGLQLLRNWLET